MSTRWTIDDVIRNLGPVAGSPIPAPGYDRPPTSIPNRPKVALAVGSMRSHMTDEGWQIMAGLGRAGYQLAGHGLDEPSVDVKEIVGKRGPDTVVVQDQREWEGRTAGPGFDQRERFVNIDYLRSRTDVFTVTILKDAQNGQAYHRDSAAAMGAHAWIVYYHPRIVAHVAPYVRPEHLLRIYHTLDPKAVPPYVERSGGAVLSGAVSGAYPLRARLVSELRRLPKTTHLPHPGYGRDRCHTPEYLRILSQYRVAICTASRYGYALRKIIEATAAGCVVLTDLPEDEILPEIDENLIRIHPSCPTGRIADVLAEAIARYDPTRQSVLAARARYFYDYEDMGLRLAAYVERLRRNYP